VLSVGQAPPKAKATQAEDEEADHDVELPFSVELGAARAENGRFGVGAIQSERGASHAFALLIGADGAAAQSVDLGRVFGDVEPPALAAAGDSWLVLSADSDASSIVLKLSALDPPFEAGSIRRGLEIPGVRRDAGEFALEVSGPEALIAFTKLTKGHGLIALARVDLKTLALKGSIVSAPAGSEGDAESPHLVRRAGGYFLAWIVRQPAAVPKATLGRPATYDAGVAEQGLVEEGPTSIEVVPLDGAGAPVGSPRRVTPANARVVAFDMVPTPDGGVLLLYRDDRDGPGLERATAEAVVLRADGTSASRTWELGETAGLPSLLWDATPPPKRGWGWLAVPNESELRLAGLGADPLALTEVRSEPHFVGAELLAALSGHLLVVRTRGGVREFSVLDCPSPE
jgi:hypothetical protein